MSRKLLLSVLGGCWIMTLLSVGSSAAADSDLRLVDAVERRDMATARALLREQVDVNTPQLDGATALHWAAHWDDLEIADLLIRAGADVNAANDIVYGVTPLSLAAVNGSAAMIERLLNAGANANTALPTGETVLMTAARSGNVDAVTALLAHGADVSAREPSSEQTALMWAAAEDHSEVARALLERGADVHAQSKGTFTPMLFGARKGALDTAKVLRSYGANVNDTARDGSAALLLATVFGHTSVAEFLLDNGADPNADAAGYSALHWAAGSWETTLTFTEDEKFNDWYSALGPKGQVRLDFIQKLLDHGADPNARTQKNPRRHGASAGLDNPHLYESLIDATPFLLAAMASDASAMRLLAAAGADPLHPTANNMTPLMMAAGVGWVIGEAVVNEDAALKAVEVALEFGADVNAVSDGGDTALHGAVLAAMDKVVEFLVAHGADVNARNKDDETPLAIAKGLGTIRAGHRGNSESTAALLRTLGALDEDRATDSQTRVRYSDLVKSSTQLRRRDVGGDEEVEAFEEAKQNDPRVK